MRLDPNFPPQFAPEAANMKGKSRQQQEAGSAPADGGGAGSAGGQGSSAGRQEGASIIDGEAEGDGTGASAGGSGVQAAAESGSEKVPDFPPSWWLHKYDSTWIHVRDGDTCA